MRHLADILNEDQWIFTVVKPGFLQLAGKIIDMFAEEGWSVDKTRTKQLTLKEAHELYAVHKKEEFYESLCEYMSSAPSMAIIYRKQGNISKKTFEETGRLKDKIRDQWGESDMRNVLHSSDSLSAMEHESAIYF